MKGLRIPYDENVIVGMDTSDDAGVYRLRDDLALIQTVDYFTPIVDDPFVFGQVAAANGLSDVYAMGGRPLTAMNIVCFSTKKFDLGVLGKILEGGLDILTKAGVQLLGGHSVEDDEIKYGISVTGVVHPGRVLRNYGLLPGDSLILTKQLGTGIVGTAVKAGAAHETRVTAFIESMRSLNREAAEAMEGFPVHACTDVTGFGLMGHLMEMIAGDSVEVAVDAANLPLLPGADEFAAMGLIPGGMYRNRDFVGVLCDIAPSVPRETADIAFDPQTSGGLLIALPNVAARDLVTNLHRRGVAHARIIGSVASSANPRIRLA